MKIQDLPAESQLALNALAEKRKARPKGYALPEAQMVGKQLVVPNIGQMLLGLVGDYFQNQNNKKADTEEAAQTSKIFSQARQDKAAEFDKVSQLAYGSPAEEIKGIDFNKSTDADNRIIPEQKPDMRRAIAEALKGNYTQDMASGLAKEQSEAVKFAAANRAAVEKIELEKKAELFKQVAKNSDFNSLQNSNGDVGKLQQRIEPDPREVRDSDGKLVYAINTGAEGQKSAYNLRVPSTTVTNNMGVKQKDAMFNANLAGASKRQAEIANAHIPSLQNNDQIFQKLQPNAKGESPDLGAFADGRQLTRSVIESLTGKPVSESTDYQTLRAMMNDIVLNKAESIKPVSDGDRKALAEVYSSQNMTLPAARTIQVIIGKASANAIREHNLLIDQQKQAAEDPESFVANYKVMPKLSLIFRDAILQQDPSLKDTLGLSGLTGLQPRQEVTSPQNTGRAKLITDLGLKAVK